MSIHELPPELQFQYLLELPFDDIISYCNTSVEASLICNDDYFWETKAMHDYDISLDHVIGDSSSQKYKILSAVMNVPGDEIVEAVRHGQEQLIRLFWEDEIILKDRDVIYATIEALRHGHSHILSVIHDLVVSPSIWNAYAENIYELAGQRRLIDSLGIISDITQAIDYEYMILEIFQSNHDLNVADMIIKDAIAHGHTSIVEDILQEMENVSEDVGRIYFPRLYKRLLETYYTPKERNERFLRQLEMHPLLEFLFQYTEWEF